MSSKPVTATSPGTARPARWNSRIAPIAIWSLAQATTSGSAARASSARAAAAPLASEKSPFSTGPDVTAGLPGDGLPECGQPLLRVG